MITRPLMSATVLLAALTLTVVTSPALADGTPSITGVTATIERPCLLRLVVVGEGFTAETNPGDNGVYVGLAPAGGMPDVADREDQDQFAASAWVRPDQMADGNITAGLNADPRTRLDPSVDYAVYTWQAHTHSNTTQDTETPVEVDWSALRTPIASTTEASIATRPTARRRGVLDVTVGGECGAAAGSVEVVARSRGELQRTRAVLDDGQVQVRLPRLAPGRWKTRVSYAPTQDGEQVYESSTDGLRLRVRR